MLIVVLVVIYGGSALLVKKTLAGEGKNLPDENNVIE